jgi:hypothetical protein
MSLQIFVLSSTNFCWAYHKDVFCSFQLLPERKMLTKIPIGLLMNHLRYQETLSGA